MAGFDALRPYNRILKGLELVWRLKSSGQESQTGLAILVHV